MMFDVGPFALRGGVTDTNGGRGGFCPRRTVLDKILVDGAVESGVELREGFTVEQLVWDETASPGVKGRSRDGGSVEERARVVIGADGAHSLRGARPSERRNTTRSHRSPRSTTATTAASRPDDVEQYVRDFQGAACFPTNDGLTLIAAVWPSERFKEVRARYRGACQEGARVDTERRRQAAACQTRREMGWDGGCRELLPEAVRSRAGHWSATRDTTRIPITAQGISDAFIDAENLTEALDAGFSGHRPLDDALARVSIPPRPARQADV